MREASVGYHCPDDVDRGARTIRQPRTTVGARLIQSPPYVTITLLALNIAAYVATGLQRGGTLRNPTGSRLFVDWQLTPLRIHEDHEYYRLITSAFLHVGLLHIGSNMLALALIGPALEQLLGRWRYGAVYLLSALGGSAAVYAFGNHVNPTVGASGAIFGLFGASLLLARRLGLDLQWLIGTVVLNFVLTFSISGISKLAHVGGFVVGVLAGLVIGGLPKQRVRVPARLQASGLGGVLVVVAALVAVGTATW